MKKIPPLDAADPNVYEEYLDPTPNVKPKGSQIPAKFFNSLNHEIENAIAASGQDPEDGDLEQLGKAITTGRALDTPFMAGISSDGQGQDLAVQEYGRMTCARNTIISGLFANVGIGPQGADLVLDVLLNGVSIYSTKPRIAAGSVNLTAGIFLGAAASVSVNAGDELIFAVTQVGSTVAGQQLTATILASAAAA